MITRNTPKTKPIVENQSQKMQHQNQQQNYIILTLSIFLLILITTLTLTPTPPTPLPTPPHPSLFPPNHHHRLLSHPPNHPPTPPSLAYLISASNSQSLSMIRLLLSVYHPNNYYLLHLDMSANQTDREELAGFVEKSFVFRSAQNVFVVGKADYVVGGDGPSKLAAEIHGASLLLRVAEKWDWFVSLRAGEDYPLVRQDDLLHVLSYLPRDLNFVNHTSYIGWRESRKLKPIVVDPSLYLAENSQMFYATQKRPLPDSYRLFTGSSTAILTRKFIEFCILGTDNLPRTLLMYLSNTPSSTPVYFPTILCNSRQFNRTTINHSLQFTRLDSRQKHVTLNSSYIDELKNSGAAFASSFPPNDPVLDRIDQELLQRSPDKPVPGGWCLGESSKDQCGVWGDAKVLRPGDGVKRLEKLFVNLLSTENNQFQQCMVE